MASIQGLDALNRKLKTLENFQRVLRKPMEEGAILMHDYIATQFRKKPGAFSAMASEGQKRAYWAQVRKGKIDHGPNGYNRQGNMKLWTMKIKMTSNGVEAEIGNNKWSGTWHGIYIGEFIQGKYQQDWLAASGIRTTVETVEKIGPKVQKKFDKAIKRELNK